MRAGPPVVVLGIAVLFAAIGCADTYCQSGPRNGTQCYSGATVRGADPLAPVAPVAPPGHAAYANPFVHAPPPAPAPPPQNPFLPKPSDAGADAADAGADAA
jgi:hypothetical protein